MPRTVRLSLLCFLSVALVAGTAPASVLDPLQVFEDPQFDHELWGEVEPSATPQAFDLKAGYIAETDKTVDFIWEYWDIPDSSGGVVEANVSYWEFSLDDPDGIVDPAVFSLRARPRWPMGFGVHTHCEVPGSPTAVCRGVGPGGGELRSHCTTTNTLLRCDKVSTEAVTVVVDDVANTITAKVQRLHLRDNDDNLVAVDGTVLVEVDVFDGIATCQGVLVIRSDNCDEADLTLNVDEETNGYTLGQPR